MSTDRSDPSLDYTLPFQLTKKIHRKVPDSLQPEREENSQKGKIIVITGGGSGLGAAAARIWVRAGAEGVVVAGRRKDKLDETVRSTQELNKSGTKVLAVQTDLKDEHAVANLFQQVNKEFGRPADVVLANAGMLSDIVPLAEESVSNWWAVWEVQVLGLHNTVTAWIRSQPDPKNPVGTVINVNSGLAGMVVPGNSAYSASKLAAHRYMEFVEADYPKIRAFTLLPGVVVTEMIVDKFLPYAGDEPEQTGALALFLASSRADYLRGSLTSVNWDLEEMEAHKAEIEKGLLKSSWLPILPTNGGSGF
ncbi:hypothetical protein N0V83_007326 [Neocucurbitaria cava]|uniref:NAD(P)-binding protein n=1 Tax=Neocucurbitaria cava TaxID=798079 RepID=A0A9W9CK43_9PLEO|nr:hypothetical protein N0V83_007326 [Neocucurbitaria cava]